MISYAASNGHNEVPISDISKFKKYIQNIQCIAVREKGFHENLVNMGIKNTLVLDPIFLLDKEEWNKIAVIPKEVDYVLSYSFSESPHYFEKAHELSKRLGKKLICFTFRKKKNVPSDAIQYYVGGPKEFLGYFNRASFVITNSFHGTAFSILYQKEFICIPPLLRRERLDSILNILEISDNVVEDNEELPSVFPKINYEKVNAILKEKRNSSFTYLETSLKATVI